MRNSKSSDNVFVALLRGVNVGGKNLISMSELKKSFAAMGFAQVTTYINSGNILFKSKVSDGRKLERGIEQMLVRKHNLECKVVIRSFSEIKRLVQSLPQRWNEDKEWRHNVIFLRHSIDSEAILPELGAKPDIEKVMYRPGTVLWSGRVSDLSRTSMLKLSSRKIFRDMTVRNPNTTRKLYELMKTMSEG